MMAVRARAEAAMAALDRRISILDDFVGQSWNSWIDKTNVSASDGSNVEECSKNVKKRMETMTLRKDDMSIYGHCPAHDDFFLVVCSHCGQVVKPQAFEKHCERRHGPPSKLYSPPSHPTPVQRPCPGRPPSQHGTSREARDGRHSGAGPPRAPPHPPPLRTAKVQNEGASFLSADKLSQGTPPSPPYSSAPSPRVPPWHHGAVPPSVPSPSEKPPQKGVHGAVDDLSPLRGPRTYSRTYKKVPKKECDLDKHCGVLDPERKKLCTRLLTCNIHSIHQRRQVVGRSKNFDQLVTELKLGSKTRERAPHPRDVPEGGSPRPEAPGGHAGPPHCRRQIANCAALRSRTPSESGEEVECSEEVEAEAQPQRLHNHSRLSSEESDAEGQEEPMDLPSNSWHPRPLGLCTFGSRALGCSVFTFDRRLHHLRFALSAMVEQHLSTHLWKKIPQVAEPRSHPTALTASSSSSSQDAADVTAGRASSLRTSTTSSLPQRAARENSTSSSLPQRTARENSTSSSLPQRTARENNTSSALPQRTARENSTSSLPQRTARENSTSSLPQRTARENSASSPLPQRTARENSASSLPQQTARENSTSSSLPQRTARENSTSSSLPQRTARENSASSSLPQRVARQNCSSGQSETKGGSQHSSSAPPPSPSRAPPPAPSRAPPASGPGRPRNPVGRPSKQAQEARLQQEEHSPTAPGKRRRSPQEDESPSPGRPPVSARTAPPAHGPINGAISPGCKPRPHSAEAPSPGLVKRSSAPPPLRTPQSPPPPPPESSHSRAGSGPGPHRKVLGYDHKGLGKRRRTSGASPPLTPPSRPSKSHSLSSPSNSNFFSWETDRKGGGVSLGLEKKLDTQKPKLHH